MGGYSCALALPVTPANPAKPDAPAILTTSRRDTSVFSPRAMLSRDGNIINNHTGRFRGRKCKISLYSRSSEASRVSGHDIFRVLTRVNTPIFHGSAPVLSLRSTL